MISTSNILFFTNYKFNYIINTNEKVKETKNGKIICNRWN